MTKIISDAMLNDSPRIFHLISRYDCEPILIYGPVDAVVIWSAM